MNRLLAAIQFITILPLGKPGIYDPRGMVVFFPIVGIIIGTIVSISDQIFLLIWPAPVVAVLDVVLLVILTGAFHIDGLGDAADGLFGHRSNEKTLSIMKDSRIGVMGLIAILSVLSIKYCGIMSLDYKRSLLLILIPAYSRGSMLFGIKFLNYGRKSDGTGYDLFNEPLNIADFSGLLLPIALSFFLGWTGLWLNVLFIGLTVSILIYYKKRLGCITGDMLGGMTETIEAMLFLLVSI
ncbi:MAG: adenosylcobinamide-GDP ribazoletransferase [Desulfosarcina sp.]|nr:adenosylcobinamide-GDP ribazoletransferase [Desulfobacterales bacterium]